VRDQQDDSQSDRSKTISAAQAQQGGENSANQNSGAVDHPIHREEGGDEGAYDRAQGRSGEALPGECERIRRREQNYLQNYYG
jgi:hypothetical protein